MTQIWDLPRLFDDLGGSVGVHKLIAHHQISYSAVRNWRSRPTGVPSRWLGVIFAEARKQGREDVTPDRYIRKPSDETQGELPLPAPADESPF